MAMVIRCFEKLKNLAIRWSGVHQNGDFCISSYEPRKGQKFASLFDAPVVYADSDEEIVLPDSKNIPIPTEYGAPAVKDGVRYEVNTTEELLRQVADSVEDVSYEQIQFEETLSDDTEVEIPDAQESEEESGTFHLRWSIITVESISDNANF